MQLLIPFAGALSDGAAQAADALRLPHLAQLLARLTPTTRDRGDEYRLSPPHERALAAALGWQGDDGTLPFAARAAAADGLTLLEPSDLASAWGLLSPVHWHVGRETMTMGDPADLGLDATESRKFFDVVRPLFESLGWRMAWGAPTRWYVAHESLAALPTASLDRVIGRNPDLWLPDHPGARLVKRLQSEAQMLLYTEPLNDVREAAGRVPLNTVWLSGCGRAQPETGTAPRVLDALRGPALHGDWAGWTAAWQALDAGPVREALAVATAGRSVTLTLCGERDAQRFEARPIGLFAGLRARWRPAPVAATLKTL